MKYCKWCDSTFETEISYQLYCSEECRNLATKEKITERYIRLRRQSRKTKPRVCKSCGERLSIYNDSVLCVKCNVNPTAVDNALKDIKRKTK